MIKSFKGKCSHDIYHGLKTKASRKLPVYLKELAAEKLDMIDAAMQVDDLKTPPGNRLEVLRGNLKGKHSIRVNDQWRVIFRWKAGNAEDVEIIDYH